MPAAPFSPVGVPPEERPQLPCGCFKVRGDIEQGPRATGPLHQIRGNFRDQVAKRLADFLLVGEVTQTIVHDDPP